MYVKGDRAFLRWLAASRINFPETKRGCVRGRKKGWQGWWMGKALINFPDRVGTKGRLYAEHARKKSSQCAYVWIYIYIYIYILINSDTMVLVTLARGSYEIV